MIIFLNEFTQILFLKYFQLQVKYNKKVKNRINLKLNNMIKINI